MKTLDRYILRQFFSPLALIVLGIAGLVLLVQVVDTLPGFRDWKAPLSYIALFHALQFPYLVLQVLPMGIMLATLISLGGLARTSELAAMRAGGISPARISQPILMAALCLALLDGAMAEWVVPASTDRAHYVQKVLIEKRNTDYDSPWRERMVKGATGGRQIYLDHYDASRGNMGGVVVLEEKDGRLLSRIDASGGRYEPEGWVLYGGVERSFNAAGFEAKVRRFKRLPLPALKEKPSDFVVESNQREEDLLLLSSAKLMRIIQVLRTTGADSRREESCLHVRLAYPLACFVLALLGCSIPFLFPSGRRAVAGAAIGLLATLAAGMLYLVCIQVGVSLGTDGVLPPMAGAWIGNLAFGGLGAVALWRANH